MQVMLTDSCCCLYVKQIEKSMCNLVDKLPKELLGISLIEKVFIALLFVTTITEIAMGLRIVHVTVPSAIESGKNAVLVCEHDLETDTLYSVKWYKGRREFFRYTPKEIPAVKVFPLPGITVDVSIWKTSTNVTQLVLQKVSPKITGRYSCEVSADAPSFHTEVATESMEVVVLPVGEPVISGAKQFYQAGEILQANCTSNGSIPSALLEWKLNKFPAYPSDIIKYDIVKDPITKLESRTIGLNFLLSQLYFVKGKLMIQCTAKIHDLYYAEAVKYVEEDRPQVYSPSLSYLSEEEFNQRKAAAAAAAAAASAAPSTAIATIMGAAVNIDWWIGIYSNWTIAAATVFSIHNALKFFIL